MQIGSYHTAGQAWDHSDHSHWHPVGLNGKIEKTLDPIPFIAVVAGFVAGVVFGVLLRRFTK